MSKKQQALEVDEPMQVMSIRIDTQELRQAKEQAKRQGRPLSLVIRKMITDWLAGQYKPFEDS